MRFSHLAADQYRWFDIVAVALMVILAMALYLPFLSNPLIFDDRGFFSSGIGEAAALPFTLSSRAFPYFTIAFVEIVSGSRMEIHRAISLTLHGASAITLYFFLLRLLTVERAELSADVSAPLKPRWLALIGSAFFAVHPVAVYGAGYLIQRTMLFATLFTLLSALYFQRALATEKLKPALQAALFYSCAVLSKEHAVLAAPAIALMLFLYEEWKWSRYRIASIFLLACFPAALAVVMIHSSQYFGTTYESNAESVMSALYRRYGSPGSEWLLSAGAQAEIFFHYLGLWLVPDTGAMSVDLRYDFERLFPISGVIARISLFATVFIGASACLLSRRRALKLAGYGLLFAMVLFLVEFSTVRFQEPFVLYRSYLWAPGFIIFFVSIARFVRLFILVPLAAVMIGLCYWGATDRLEVFNNNLALWQDAASKLPNSPFAGSARTYYARGMELANVRRYAEALEDMNRVIALEPHGYRGYYGRVSTYLGMKNYQAALGDLDLLDKEIPNNAMTLHYRGIVLEGLKRREEAMAAYRKAAALGFWPSELRLQLMVGSSASIKFK